MQKNELTILIVEDDATLGKALCEGILRSGFKAIHVSKPDDALAAMKIHTINAAVIDCMLPKMNGRDLARQIHQELVPDLPIFLMSGVYRDKSFAREAIVQTNAAGFLIKPFDLSDLVTALEQRLESLIDVPLAPLQEIFARNEASHKVRIKALNEQCDVHGYELVWIFSLLMHPRVSGHLNVISADGEVCGVGFQNGQIIQVNQKDAKSYFGVLMVENGFVTQEEIDAVVKADGGKTKKLGERLLEAGVLSPHAIHIVMAEQQGIRLSRTIAETSVKVNFIESDELREDAVIDRTTFTELLNEWLMSKISSEWLKSAYLPWSHYTIAKGAEYSPNHRVFTIPVVQRVPKLAQSLLSSTTLEQALSRLTEPEEHVFAAMHALFVSRVLRFDELKTVRDFDTQRSRLRRLDQDLERQNFFERLGVSQKAKESEIKRAYHDFAKILHPDKLVPETPPDIRELAHQAFAKLSQAYETLANEKSRAVYVKELELGRADAVFEAEHLMDNARQFLTKGDFSKAREQLEQAIAVAPPTTNMRLLLMWSKLKSTGAERNKGLLDKIKEGLAQIPPEDRHQPTFLFVKGLHFKASGDLESARKSFEHAVSVDSDFIDARRELSLLKAQISASDKPVDLLRGDLKDVVGLLFKKKK